LSGNAVSDILIASSMLYHVNILHSLRVGSSKADFDLELTKRRKEADGFFHDSALLKVVRLTMETNLLTSEYILDFGETTLLTHVLASMGVISLLVIVIFPVSGQQIATSSVVDMI